VASLEESYGWFTLRFPLFAYVLSGVSNCLTCVVKPAMTQVLIVLQRGVWLDTGVSRVLRTVTAFFRGSYYL
jgi:hypothetical protein